MMKTRKLMVNLGLLLPWILVLFGIPVGTYYIDHLAIRVVYMVLVILTACVTFGLAKAALLEEQPKQ